MPRVSQGTRTNAKHKAETLPTSFQAGFITALDGRTELARGLKERFESIATDLGGLHELSNIKASLVERFCWLEASLSKIEHDMASADTKTSSELLARWVQGCNSLLGIARTLGIDRKLQAAPWLDSL
ncbi:MAG: hypothetical protein JW395_1525 [Nitrospira sp.]|nr:hypothetical protein [Nitrospira sp.]